MIRAEHIYKSFDGIPALTDLSLRVQKGSIYGLIGVNGAGKTTAINLLSGIYKADKGEITLDGEPVYDSETAKKRIGLISDAPWFPARSTLKSQAAFRSRIYPDWDSQTFTSAAETLKLETDLDNITGQMHKVQISFEDENRAERLCSLLKIIHREKHGSVDLWIVKETEARLREIISRENPRIFDILPMTLEEIFIYELRGDCHDYEEIL